MKFNDRNPFPGLAEVKAQMADVGSDGYELLTELRIHPTEVDGYKYAVLVQVHEATLSLEFEGFDVVPQSKFGQPVVENNDQASGPQPHLRVKAIGHDKWKVSERDQKALDAVYIDHEPLCGLKSSSGTNRKTCIATLTVRQKHLRLAASPSPLFGVSQEKLLAVLLAKSLHERTASGPFRGELVLSRTETSDED